MQATSYALMVYLFNNRFVEAERIMEWLQTQRQSVNAWVGTQVRIMNHHSNTLSDLLNPLKEQKLSFLHRAAARI